MILKDFKNYKDNEMLTITKISSKVDSLVREQFTKDLEILNSMKKEPNFKFKA